MFLVVKKKKRLYISCIISCECPNKAETARRRSAMRLTCQDDHVHAPEDAHDPAHHDDGRRNLDESGGHVEPKDAARAALGHQLAAGAAQHREG